MTKGINKNLQLLSKQQVIPTTTQDKPTNNSIKMRNYCYED